MFDLGEGMRIAQLRAGASGRQAYPGLGNITMTGDMLSDVANEAAQATTQVKPRTTGDGGNTVIGGAGVDPKVALLDPKGGVTPAETWEAAAASGEDTQVQTRLAPVPQGNSILDKFNALSTPAKVGVVGGGVVAVAGIAWLLKG